MQENLRLCYSHARKSASLLQDNLNKDYGVSSFVKPGADMKAITDTAGGSKILQV
jgi:hypothetical protein